MAKKHPMGRRAKAQALPGMEDRKIAPLEALAADVAAIREQRADLAAQELGLRRKALAVLKQLGKTVYRRDGIEMEIVHGEDAIKLKVVKHAAPAED